MHQRNIALVLIPETYFLHEHCISYLPTTIPNSASVKNKMFKYESLWKAFHIQISAVSAIFSTTFFSSLLITALRSQQNQKKHQMNFKRQNCSHLTCHVVNGIQQTVEHGHILKSHMYQVNSVQCKAEKTWDSLKTAIVSQHFCHSLCWNAVGKELDLSLFQEQFCVYNFCFL